MRRAEMTKKKFNVIRRVRVNLQQRVSFQRMTLESSEKRMDPNVRYLDDIIGGYVRSSAFQKNPLAEKNIPFLIFPRKLQVYDCKIEIF
ncbi:MAG: hypothetical protein PG980_000871 [Wolbachia endosymbiont of Ctenocephalides felis wCfeJ]|nr:MAG: hypothetical protein PG980_000871 [Wolbachia endosymbiont of Ctenocephalides felis wCfeJ]